MQTDSTVFLVDDDPAALDSLCWLLKSHGLKCQAHSSAAEFLDAYDPNTPGCLVLDIRMPEMDGLELQDKLVSLGQRLPIIFATGHGDVSSSVQAFRAGAVDFLEKPIDAEQLFQAVHDALEQDRRQRRWEQQHADIAGRIKQLSSREREIMEFLYDGKSMKQIATELGSTAQTVAKHRTQVLEKMEVESDVELTRMLAAGRLQHS